MKKSLTTQDGIQRSSERGNVLFLILIAVALFAALSYAVTQSTRSGGGDAGRETNLVNSSTITQYPASIKTAIVRMIVSNGATAETLEFNPPSTFSALTSTSLGVFHPTGGGATYAFAPTSVTTTANQTWHFNGENQVLDIGVNNGLTGAPNQSSADLVAFLPNVKTAICTQIHTQLGISTTLVTETGVATTVDQTNALGTTSDRFTETGSTIGGTALSPLKGQPQGCFIQSGINVYYHVLVER